MQGIFREKIAPVLGRSLQDHFAAVLKEPLPSNLGSSLDQLELVFRPEFLIASGAPTKVSLREVTPGR